MKFEKLKFKVEPYRQTLKTSCLSSAFLMIGHFYFPYKFSLNKTQEKKIHEKIKFNIGEEGELRELESFSKLALFAIKKGFKIKYFLIFKKHKKPRGISLENWKKLKDSFLLDLKKIKNNKSFKLIKRCTIRDIKKELKRGALVICEKKYDHLITHAIVIRGYEGDIFYIIDPLTGYQKYHSKDLKKEINLGYQKSFMSFIK